MATIDTFSKRKALQEGKVAPLQSTELPNKFRVQVVHLLIAALGRWTQPRRLFHGNDDNGANITWGLLHNQILEELGLFTLSRGSNPEEDCCNFVLSGEVDNVVDLLELALTYVEITESMYGSRPQLIDTRSTKVASEVVQTFNKRCLENGVGYQFQERKIIPVASSFVHAQVVEPALTLLHRQGFEGARDEFMQAFGHLRRGDTKSAIVEALKAFESTMKAICTQKEWDYDPGKAMAKDLIAILLEKGLIPTSLQTQFANFRSLLESGVPTVRNKNGGHGQGPDPIEVPRELAEYAIHLTASNIVFLVGLLK